MTKENKKQDPKICVRPETKERIESINIINVKGTPFTLSYDSRINKILDMAEAYLEEVNKKKYAEVS